MRKQKVRTVIHSPQSKPNKYCVCMECGHSIWVKRPPQVGQIVKCEACPAPEQEKAP